MINARQFHEQYKYTYFITLTTNYKEHSAAEIFKKLRNYLYWHDVNSHIISVKELTTINNGLHYHILYFTNIKLDYSRIHKHMPSYADINIQLVNKTEEDIENVLNYMNKIKKSSKSKSLSNKNDSKLKVIPKLDLFDFQIKVTSNKK